MPEWAHSHGQRAAAEKHEGPDFALRVRRTSWVARPSRLPVSGVRKQGHFPLSTYAVRSSKLPGREMRDLWLDEAAAVLCVSPDTLRTWERRFSFPRQVAGAAGQHRYIGGEVFALRDSSETGLWWLQPSTRHVRSARKAQVPAGGERDT